MKKLIVLLVVAMLATSLFAIDNVDPEKKSHPIKTTMINPISNTNQIIWDSCVAQMSNTVQWGNNDLTIICSRKGATCKEALQAANACMQMSVSVLIAFVQ